MSVDSIVNLAAGKIGELLLKEAKLLYGVDGQVQSLQQDLITMNSFLGDMDEERVDRVTRNMINQTRRIAYDAEDVIETYILEKASSSSSNKKVAFFKRYPKLLRTHQVGSGIADIKERIAKTTENWKKYGGENGGKRNAGEGMMRRTRLRVPIAYPDSIEEHVVGLEEDINKLIEVLTIVDETHNFKVVSIVGMGGSGKTTLARKLYNHGSVKTHFDYMAWISISQQWDTKKILLELLRKASGETKGEDLSLGEISEKLHVCFARKRYLIVLDDVWTKQALEDILPPLQPSANDGRKVIITTRKKEVVDFPDLKCFFHEPRRLTEEESWELFRKITLIHRVDPDATDFEALGKEMLKKCGGLPLAVIALAGILCRKETLEEWEKVNKAVSSRIVEEGRGTHLYGPVKEMLTLSYIDLPRELKPCFLYLAIFPEDYEIPVEMLCQMWIAECFITSDQLHGGDTVEDVANQYLNELILRCVVQIGRRNYQGNVKTIRIHDLVRDLCIKKAKEQDFLEILSSNSPNSDSRMTESRRIAIHSDGPKIGSLYLAAENRISLLEEYPTKSQHLRSLYLAAKNRIRLGPIHQNFRLLRVLFLEGIETPNYALPTGIGSLIHLRYLRLYNTGITQLPSSIGNLCNLLTLDYRGVRGSSALKIPDVVWKMEGLTHLYLPFGESYGKKSEEFILRLHTLKYLQTLHSIKGGKWMLEELPCLTPTVQKLRIVKGITSNKQLDAAFQCPSIRSDTLHSLRLDWLEDTPEGEDVLRVESLEQILQCQHLRKLRLRGRIEERLGGIRLPTSIKKLVLAGTDLKAEATLANLGKLPNLIVLKLEVNSYWGTKWTCTARDHFPQLRELCLTGLEELEEWSIERGAMPLLTKLTVDYCKKLRRVPEGLKYITTLKQVHLLRISSELKKRFEKGGEDAHLFLRLGLIFIYS